MSGSLTLLKEKHIRYIESLDTKKHNFEYWLTEHLRLNGIYWGLTALCVLDSPETFVKEEVISFVLSCWDDKYGAFAPFPRHDAHLLTTLSAVQILATYDALDVLGKDRKVRLISFIRGNQLEDGSFQGDRFGEVDTRFVYTALSALSILGELTPEVVDPAVDFVLKCYNFDGGFGLCPNAESHAAQAFTCLGALAIANKLDMLSNDQLEEIGWWLCERQLPEGGLNGRPSKLPDVCYSWWVLSSLAIIGRLDWINYEKLTEFILKCQDEKKGGISDRPENEVDVFHTVFGIAGLSLMGYDNLVPIDPIYCMPKSVTAKFKKYPYK
ncbi:BAD_collapsed_G0058050.mRNA.1.CDS.1 [Saccharomyces cerevisiae]|nr:Bet2p [Saccharomyces cerevisiae YJM195]CAI4796621.1 CEQ_1a_G0056600.mRNA.1.CDS.1 [Saccharomyces cerevisiae]CAI4865187.1 AKH_1a_G0056140.mRNA.1.CDS.1 [Saccharomyces cerevisiae]CAI6913707.1 AKH_1a_G0056140.mRNA.1.CDS.1 [Saccharomyces cerevisiae]CAI7470382.1 CEQ_1a_G0056600.mRNA.1.CDS.1 [Saccharomyces cerevisiae]